jgi:predicted membrane protein (TIGR00267 family)
MMRSLRHRIDVYRRNLEQIGADEIARRYFVLNAFDGALTILGVVVGFAISHGENPRLVLSAGAGAGLAMGISGAVGAYMAETAERRQQLQELEGHMFQSLEGTKMGRAVRQAALWVAFVDGISPAMAAAIPIIPFLLVSRGIITMQAGIAASIILDLATLFMLGVFLARVSGGNKWLRGFLMLGAGLVTALVLLALDTL